MKAILKIGRFQKDQTHMQFLKGLQQAGRKFHILTETEQKLLTVKKHLREDLKKHVKPKGDGLDPKSIVSRETERMRPAAMEELRKLQVEYLNNAIRVAKKFMEELEQQREELAQERGSVVFMERQRLIKNAQRKIAEKEEQEYRAVPMD